MQNWRCKFTKFNDLSNSLAAWKDAWESAKFVWAFPGNVACEANIPRFPLTAKTAKLLYPSWPPDTAETGPPS
jgi:hypothetical protein